MISLGLSILHERPLEVGFNPLDIGSLLIHYDFASFLSKKNYVTKSDPAGRLRGQINDNIASSGAISYIRLQTGNQFHTSVMPDAGIVKVNNEYFAYSGYTNSSTDVTVLNNVTRAQAGSSEAAHSSGDEINVLAGSYAEIQGTGAAGSGDGLRDFTDWSTAEMKIPNLGSAGGYVTLSDETITRPGTLRTELGTNLQPVLQFDGENDRLPLNAAVTTSSGDFSVVVIFRADGGPSSDAVIGGSSGGINQFKFNSNTVLFRANSSGSSNAYNQIRANNTTAYAVGSRGTPVDKGGTGNSFLGDQNECIIFIKEKNSTDNKEKVYLYDVKDLIAEDLLNDSSVAGQAGYPDSSENPSNTGFQIAHIGALSNDTGDFGGEIAEILVYDKALTAEEVVLLQSYYDNRYADLHHE